MVSYPRRRMRTLMSMGLAVKGAVVASPSTPVAAYSPAFSGLTPPAAMMVRRGSSARRLPTSSVELVDRDLVELDAVDAGPGNGPARGGAGACAGGVVPCEGERLFGVHLDEQLLLDAA